MGWHRGNGDTKKKTRRERERNWKEQEKEEGANESVEDTKLTPEKGR